MAAATTARGSGAHHDAAIVQLIEGPCNALNETMTFRGMRHAMIVLNGMQERLNARCIQKMLNFTVTNFEQAFTFLSCWTWLIFILKRIQESHLNCLVFLSGVLAP